jgi:MerR family transcriptional regulator, mercuric resistance operon regulatory protein
VKRARELGFAQDEVRAILNLGGPASACCDEVRDIAVHHLTQVRRKIADLAAIEKLLSDTVQQCSGGHVAECAVIDMLESVRS